MSNDGGNSLALSLVEQAAAQVKERTEQGEVIGNVVKALADERVDRRTELLLNAVRDRKCKVRRLSKIKPAIKGYNEAGEEIPGDALTRCQVDQIKALREEIEELDTAINAQDFDKLSDMGY